MFLRQTTQKNHGKAEDRRNHKNSERTGDKPTSGSLHSKKPFSQDVRMTLGKAVAKN